MVYTQSRICPRNETQKINKDLKVQSGRQIPVKKPKLVFINKNKTICHLVYFAVPADHASKRKKKQTDWHSGILSENWKNYETWRWRKRQL